MAVEGSSNLGGALCLIFLCCADTIIDNRKNKIIEVKTLMMISLTYRQ
jgi:hypothetical protein